MPQTILDSFSSIEILEGVKALAPVLTLWVAYRALKNWQRQDKAKREAEFLDQLLDAAHSYASEMQRPLALLDIAQSGIAFYVDDAVNHDPNNAQTVGTILYIKAMGRDQSNRMLETLNAAGEPLTKLRSLVVKGQMFKFPGYSKCRLAEQGLVHMHYRMQSFAAIIGSSSDVNWNDEEVRNSMIGSTNLHENEVREVGERQHTVIVNFARDTYAHLYDPPDRLTRLLRFADAKLRAWKSPTAPPQS